MKKLISALLPLLTIALFLQSCGPSFVDITRSMLDEGRNDEVIARMRRALINEPDNNNYLRLMGTAMYNKKMYRDAIKTFQQVLADDEEDDQSAFYAASSFEELKEYDKAIQYYRLYNELTTFGDYKEIVNARIKILYKLQMEAEAKRAIAMEAQLEVAKVPSNTVAILYFENKGTNNELDPLQKGLAEMIITDLAKVNSLKVVERIRLQKLIEEMNLGETDLVDPKTAPRMGKLLGAARLIKGSFFDVTKEKVRIDALIAKTKSGDLDGTTNISGTTQEFFRMQKELVFKILEQMKVSITEAEREAIYEIPTENFFAFLQYSRGLDYEDKGMYKQAAQAFSQAAVSDPNFSQAKTSAVTAQKADDIAGSTSSDNSASSSQQTTTTTTTTTQSTSGSKPGSTKSGGPSAPMAPPPPSSAFGPGQNPELGRNLNTVTVTNSTTTPGTNSTTPPPPQIIEAAQPLKDPPRPPGQ